MSIDHSQRESIFVTTKKFNYRFELVDECKAVLLNTKTIFDYSTYPGRLDIFGRRFKTKYVSSQFFLFYFPSMTGFHNNKKKNEVEFFYEIMFQGLSHQGKSLYFICWTSSSKVFSMDKGL